VIRLVIPLTGGMHQALHLLPVAVALQRRGHRVRILPLTVESRSFTERMLARYGESGIAVAPLGPGPLERLAARLTGRRRPRKTLRLIENLAALRGADAVIVTESTTAKLRRLGLLRGPIIHIQHGAGDRAVGDKERTARYDFQIVAGAKDRARFLAAGAAPDRVAACGYIKLAGVAAACPAPPRLFANGQPAVLYNPHFSKALGSFEIASALIDAFAARGDLNLIVAPHIRLAERLSPADRLRIEASAAPNILVDLGSEASCDMSYTRAADIYLGDVSSQIYEFETQPRPAVFIDSASSNWRGNPNFAMWAMGEVVPADPGAIMRAIDAAPERHAAYVAEQRRLVGDSLGEDWAGAPERAADAILAFLGRQLPAPGPTFANRAAIV